MTWLDSVLTSLTMLALVACKTDEELPCGRARFEQDVKLDDRGELCGTLEFGDPVEARHAAGECLVEALAEGRRAWAVLGKIDESRPAYEYAWYVREPSATPRVWGAETALAGPNSDFGSSFAVWSSDGLELETIESCEGSFLLCVSSSGGGAGSEADSAHTCYPDDCPCPE